MSTQDEPAAVQCPRGTGPGRKPASARRARGRGAAADSPLRGRPLRQRVQLERTTIERYLRAAGGPLLYMRRLREIEEGTRRHEQALAGRLEELAATTAPAALAAAWRREAEAWDFGDVNRLIEQHNRWYPVEAQLPMNPRTGDYALVGGQPYIRRPLDTAWILDRFPAPVQTL